MRSLVLSVSAALAMSAAGPEGRMVEIRAGALTLTLDSKSGNLVALRNGFARVPLRQPRPLFQVRDIKARTGFVPLSGPVTRNRSEYVIKASARSLGLTARISFRPSPGMLAYLADIVDTHRRERGFVISMTLPLQQSGLVWSGDLYQEEAVRPGELYGNNTIPISAIRSATGNWAIAAAIPPTSPVMYDTHFKDGDFGLYYYVGVSSSPRELPGRTWVAGF